jgi:hypothetical protein
MKKAKAIILGNKNIGGFIFLFSSMIMHGVNKNLNLSGPSPLMFLHDYAG